MMMKPFLGSTVASIAAVSCANIAHAELASSEAVIVDISSQFEGMPGYEGLRTLKIYLQFTDPADTLLNHTAWNVTAHAASFFNSEPVPRVASGNIPVNPAFIEFGLVPPDYAWDTYLSMDGSTASLEEPGMSFTPAQIGGRGGPGSGTGVFVTPPYPAAGDDLLIEVAQMTICDGGIFLGSFTANTPSSVSGTTSTTICFFCTLGTFDDGDLNLDFCVDGLDLGTLLANWSIPAGSPACGGDLCCPADINRDGVVDGLDLGILLSNWTAPALCG